MRPLLFLSALSVLAIPSPAEAGCTTGSLDVLPWVDVVLPQDARIVLTGSGVYADEITQLAARAPRLVSDGDEVALAVTILPRGEASRASALLVPERPLEADARYTLELSAPGLGADGAPQQIAATPSVYRWSGRDDPDAGYHQLSWRVEHSPARAPRWLRRPVVKKMVIGQFCPYPAYVEVSAPVEDRSRVLAYELVVKRAQGGVTLARALEAASEGPIAIGHLGCERNALMVPGVRYRVQITALGLDGARVPAPGEVLVSAPAHRR